MKKRYITAISLTVYVLLLWLLHGVVMWLAAGIIAGIASSIYLSREYDRAYEKEKYTLLAEGLKIDPKQMVGLKKSTIGFFIIFGLICGMLSYGVDSAVSSLLSFVFN